MVEKSAGTRSFILGTNGVLRKRKWRSESDGDLSDLDDAEITGYLNSDREMLIKKMLWEAMNKDYPKQKQRKPTTGKKSTAKKAVASRIEKGKEDKKENKKRLSSKINYDALEKPSDEFEEVAVKAKTDGVDSNWDNQTETQQSKGTSGTSSLEVCGFEEDNFSDEVEPENFNLHSNGDEEEDGYGYQEDYDHDEF